MTLKFQNKKKIMTLKFTIRNINESKFLYVPMVNDS